MIWPKRTYFITLVCFSICANFAFAQKEQLHVVGNGTCNASQVTFELLTGFVYSWPDDILDTRPDSLLLSECIQACRDNSSCQSINFETGLCVLFSSSSETNKEALSRSQFPVYTLYAKKICLRAAPVCNGRPWAFETVEDSQLAETFVKSRRRVASRQACMELCVQERDFPCRSASFKESTGECSWSDVDRYSVTARSAFQNATGVQYFETNCVDDPVKMCDFTKNEGRILKTVDAVIQDVESKEECQKLCLNADFRCHSYDYGDTGDKICRFSHHAFSTLTQIQDPYLDIPGTSTYELTSCYNVTIDCRSNDMLVKVKTNRIFNGKIYSKTRPNSCVTDVTKGLDFELRMGYQDLGCDVKLESPGKYITEVVIQHHDQIVTSQDLGLTLRCSYELQNYTLSSALDLSISSRLPTSASQSAVVPAPTVTMRISARNGDDIAAAQVGDPLSLRFEVAEPNSPYEIFVRELVAMDGVDNSEILLIDSMGCPTDQDIMGPISKVNGSGKVLQAPFDAFKFPTSDIVQFKALVTPCLPSCKPVQCNVHDYLGYNRRIDSFGRRRRQVKDTSSAKSKDKQLVVQSIRISDKFQFPEEEKLAIKSNREARSDVAVSKESTCFNLLGVLIAGALLIAAQAVLIGAWAYMWHRKRQSKMDAITGSALPPLAGKSSVNFPSSFNPYQRR